MFFSFDVIYSFYRYIMLDSLILLINVKTSLRLLLVSQQTSSRQCLPSRSPKNIFSRLKT